MTTEIVPAVVVDGKPLCHLPNSKSCELDRLEIAIRQLQDILEPIGGLLKVYVDASLPHSLGSSDRKRLDNLIRSKEIAMTPAGVPADSFILEWADNHHALVVSTDLYREFKVSYPWLSGQGRTIGPSFDEVDREWMFFERATGRGKVPRSLSELLVENASTTSTISNGSVSDQSGSKNSVVEESDDTPQAIGNIIERPKAPDLNRPRIRLRRQSSPTS
jgi:hypothetical protein